MIRIIKALILGWIGKKIYDRTLGHSSADDASEPETGSAAKGAHPKSAAARKSAPKRTTRKTTRRAA